MLIRDSAQKIRANQPLETGLSPWVAERLTSYGIDPHERAAQIRARHASFTAQHRQTPGERVAAVRARLGNLKLKELGLSPNDVVVRELIQQAALDTYNDDLIAGRICPEAFVDVREGEYKLRDNSTERQELDDLIGPKSEAQELPQEITAGTFKVNSRARKDYVLRAVANIAPDIESRMIIAMRIRQHMLLQHEIRVATTLMAAASYDASCVKTVASGAEWNGGASADPIDDMQDIIAAARAPLTHGVMSLEVWQAAQNNDELKAILASQINNKGLLDPMTFALYFGLDEVHINRGQKVASGATSLTRIYGTASIALVHVSSDPEARTFLRNFVLRQGSNGLVSTQWYEPKMGELGADYEQLAWAQIHKVIDAYYGGLIVDVRQ